MQRDGAEIMLLRINGYRKPDLASLRSEGYWDAYIRMGGVKELHETLAARGAAVTPLVKRFYGNLEFEMRDLNGYVLVFAEFTLEGTVPAEEIA